MTNARTIHRAARRTRKAILHILKAIMLAESARVDMHRLSEGLGRMDEIPDELLAAQSLRVELEALLLRMDHAVEHAPSPQFLRDLESVEPPVCITDGSRTHSECLADLLRPDTIHLSREQIIEAIKADRRRHERQSDDCDPIRPTREAAHA